MVDSLADEQLVELGFTKLGQRLAFKRYCRDNDKGKHASRKSELVERVKSKLCDMKEKRSKKGISPHAGKSGVKQSVRTVSVGWKHLEGKTFRQVRSQSGGGMRRFAVSVSDTLDDVLRQCKELFFPDDHSSKGHMDQFHFSLSGPAEKELELSSTVSAFCSKMKFSNIRFYMLSRHKYGDRKRKKLMLGPADDTVVVDSDDAGNDDVELQCDDSPLPFSQENSDKEASCSHLDAVLFQLVNCIILWHKLTGFLNQFMLVRST